MADNWNAIRWKLILIRWNFTLERPMNFLFFIYKNFLVNIDIYAILAKSAIRIFFPGIIAIFCYNIYVSSTLRCSFSGITWFKVLVGWSVVVRWNFMIGLDHRESFSDPSLVEIAYTRSMYMYQLRKHRHVRERIESNFGVCFVRKSYGWIAKDKLKTKFFL